MKMKTRKATIAVIASALALLGLPPLDAQLKEWVKDAVRDETRRQVGRAVRGAIRCAVGEHECERKAREQGKEVVYVDDDGEIITDANGDPVMDRDNLPPHYRSRAPAATSAAPPPAISATYDFEPGDRVILYEDYAEDVPGDFPRNLELVRGSWDIVDYGDQRMLRNSGRRHSAIKVPLPETLPDQFTIETTVLIYGQTNLALATQAPEPGPEHINRLFHTDFNYFDIGAWGVGVVSRDTSDVTAVEGVGSDIWHTSSPYGNASGPVPIRIMADGSHVKVYVGEKRVANVPNADLRRTAVLWLEADNGEPTAERPILIGPIRVAGGGRDLYDALAADGRVAVHDILFDVDQATIKPASAEVLNRIGTMLTEHAEMSLMIEGHTDSTGDFDHNMDLSQRRAEAVKQWLVAHHAIADTRLRSMGLGSTQPKESNDTEEGQRQNRRVELVKVSG
jgi:outer membrane protein OmpA-like peptidoglycan-associated protein